ncbi:1862_t:CDS:2 [Ambispora gerdemannii]|uniref:1862_t:CDS:1 n=1 Tax=Ambispora gerdemannii TaxID=144530 RepID=A0A9N9F4G6_9GLOM|nr:1862_t:CDS:2 [Ambispora gerdemannii]
MSFKPWDRQVDGYQEAEKICLVYVSEVDGTGHSEETRLVCVSRSTVNTGSLTQD